MYINISYAFVSVSVCVSVYVYDEIIYSMFVQTWGYAYSHIYINIYKYLPNSIYSNLNGDNDEI